MKTVVPDNVFSSAKEQKEQNLYINHYIRTLRSENMNIREIVEKVKNLVFFKKHLVPFPQVMRVPKGWTFFIDGRKYSENTIIYEWTYHISYSA